MVGPRERPDRIVCGADGVASDALAYELRRIPKGPGRFKLILQSAISGRALQEPVDEEGPGEGTAYAADDPRVFHILVESANLDCVHGRGGRLRNCRP